MPKVKNIAWFIEWFNSPYYDLLYKERDQEEADAFIKNLIAFLSPAPHSLMLDIACGKGRHTLSLNKMGYVVDGFDLSEKNILAAKKYETPTLSFYTHDMRKPFMVNYYDIVFNLFTSFGYFEKDRENLSVLHNIYNAIRPGGIFVLDFMNMEKTLHHILAHEEKCAGNVKFSVSKSINARGFLIKQIHVTDDKLKCDFEERVKIFTLATLKKYVSDCGFEIIKIFGDYQLSDFNASVSDRLIIISRKK